MAAMTLDPTSRGVTVLPKNVYPNLNQCTPPLLPLNLVTQVIVNGNNMAWGSSLQVDGVDSASATWVSPWECRFTISKASARTSYVTITSPEGLVSNPARLMFTAK